MLAIRRVSASCRNKGVGFCTARICSGTSDIGGCTENYFAELYVNQGKPFSKLLASTKFNSSKFSFSSPYGELRKFSSQVGVESGGDDLEDGFSELETPHGVDEDTTSEPEHPDDEVPSKPEFSEEDGVSEELVHDLEAIVEGDDVGEKISEKKSDTSAMTRAIFNAPSSPVSTILDKWVEKGNEVTRAKVSSAMLKLRRRRLFSRALQLSEWLESGKHIELSEQFYASRVDLIAKVRGIPKAEEYIKSIPDIFRGGMVYSTLLSNCVSAVNVKKSEEVFNKMKASKIPVSCFACNQMLFLYKRTNKKKIADLLVFMEKENIRPSLFTYQLLIDVKGQAKDIDGMEKILTAMKDEGLDNNTEIQSLLARHYSAAGLKDKAEAILKEMEGDDLPNRRWICRLILPIYASLGRDDEVSRIWKVCESDPHLEECVAAVEAWGQLKKVDNAEAAFEKLLTKVKEPLSRHFSALLRVYADNKMLIKGKDLVKRMANMGCTIGPLTWDGLVKLYIGAGEVEKADSIIEKAIKQNLGKPLVYSFMLIMDGYAKRGDIHNAEKIFVMMKRAGYTPRIWQYQSLLDAYLNAKAPAYGFIDRMRADNIVPNKSFSNKLAQADAFRKSAVSELLD